uniref:Uncharacterized protein n=1 Tax=Rhizophora mucronata TaxID=61149 RepID=A0A2P2NS58_RHIMU
MIRERRNAKAMTTNLIRSGKQEGT